MQALQPSNCYCRQCDDIMECNAQPENHKCICYEKLLEEFFRLVVYKDKTSIHADMFNFIHKKRMLCRAQKHLTYKQINYPWRLAQHKLTKKNNVIEIPILLQWKKMACDIIKNLL